ncbi:MAG: nuclear transport factor 2 family protein [Acidimicrobiales bacterium]|nr:nuclear transport factor 2 family protein [Acidimicrobiales bacterium]
MSGGAPSAAEITELLARYWNRYDAGDIDGLGPLLTTDTRFVTRTDTGATDYEEFVRCDVTGRAAAVEWQRPHRADSPFPLRHCTVNIVADPVGDDAAAFESYLLVTQTHRGKPDPITTAVVRGRVERGPEGLQLALLEVVLDTAESVPFREVRGAGS